MADSDEGDFRSPPPTPRHALADKFLSKTKGKGRHFKSPEPEEVSANELDEMDKLTTGDFDNKLFNFIVSSDFKGEVAESSIAMIMNFIVIAYLLTCFGNLGIYSYLYRDSNASSSSVRARQLMFGEIEPTSIDTELEFNTWMFGTFIPNFFEPNSYQTTCSMESMRAKPYAYGELPKIPVFTVRMLGDKRTHGCESPYFNFRGEVEVGPFHLNDNKKCNSMGHGSEAGGDMDYDHGAMMFATTYGMNCPRLPSIPSMIPAMCTSKDQPLCNASRTFCEGYVWSSRCVNETGGGCSSNNFLFEGTKEAIPINRDATIFTAATNTNAQFELFSEAGFLISATSMYPAEGGPKIVNTKENIPYPDDESYNGSEYDSNFQLNNLTGPFLYLDPKMSCSENWDTYSAYWIAEVESKVRNTFSEAYSSATTKGMIITAYFPFKDGTVVEAVVTFEFGTDGSMESEVHMHVKPLVDTIPKNAVTTIMWQAVLISLYACSTFSFLFSHLILIITTALGFTFAQTKSVPTDPSIGCRLVGILCSGASVTSAYLYFYDVIVTDEAGECWSSGECEPEPKNKLVACAWIAVLYFIADTLLKIFQIYEIRIIYGLPLSFWHIATAAFDVVLFVIAFTMISVVTDTSAIVGSYLERVSYGGDNIVQSPWNSWVEEAVYHEIERDKLDGLFVGVLMFFCVLRILKYLSIFPMLGVPVTAIAAAARELTMFMVVLALFNYGFTLLLMFGFGAQVEAFSGVIPAFFTLFTAILDGDVSDEVYDEFEKMGWTTSHVTYGYAVVICFRLFISIMFMNMLITIIMEHYGDVKARPENAFIVNPKEVESYKGYFDEFKEVSLKGYQKMKAQFNLMFGGMPHVTLSKKEDKKDPSNVEKMLQSWRVNGSPKPDDEGLSCVPQVKFGATTVEPQKAPSTEVPRVVDADSVASANDLVAQLNSRLDSQEGQIAEILKNQTAVTGSVVNLNRIIAELLVHGNRRTRGKSSGPP